MLAVLISEIEHEILVKIILKKSGRQLVEDKRAHALNMFKEFSLNVLNVMIQQGQGCG